MSGGAIGAMTAVIVGFVAAAVIGVHETNEKPPSPSKPGNN